MSTISAAYHIGVVVNHPEKAMSELHDMLGLEWLPVVLSGDVDPWVFDPSTSEGCRTEPVEMVRGVPALGFYLGFPDAPRSDR
ncbi:hypothetical protein NDR87_15080 [Nocardia sp. CDC159]|uniref:Uncharacterized protein n=1 Tax=Nocardia pulmonis TaxID=2951408 RepID=A0A9X2J030_9NOCA|nr:MULTISPECIES: hypothetical protein [Nocardia]MCM6775586.1 hypothetical protein [Nocardia pulmonis]MCM6787680.1 hypothetical protein [Nocardia sp. CDC159]